ncbi:MAG: DUF3696 domain-containing protein [Candidatus Aminicenantes bacterium]|jgi:predicted ATPase
MAHFSRLCLKNFRVFKDFTEFEFAPITVLAGTNNSGKSSVFKALALLTENAEKTSLEKMEFFENVPNDDNFTTIKNRNSRNSKITFEFDLSNFEVSGSFANYSSSFHEVYFNSFILPYPPKLTVICAYEQENENGKLVKFELLYYKTKILSFHIDFKRGHSIYLNIQWLMNLSEEQKFWGVNDKFLKKLLSNSTRTDFLKFIRILDKKILEFLSSCRFSKQQWTQINKRSFVSGFDKADCCDIISTYVRFFNRFGLNILESPIDSLFSKEEISKYNSLLEKLKGKAISEVLSPITRKNYILYFEPFLHRIINKVAGLLKVKYIRANRAKQRRIYSPGSQNDDCDDLFFKMAHSDLSPEISAFMKHWMNIFGIGTDIHFEVVKGVATIVSIVRESKTYDLADIGVGSIQLLSIIFNIALLADNKWAVSQDKFMGEYTMKKRFKVLPDGKIKIKNLGNDYGVTYEDDKRYKNKEFSKIEFFNYNTLLIEEPETNLHPNLQSKLAEMFVEAERKFNIQFIIETHSEYLIRNLQLQITEGNIKSNNVNIYYLNDSNDGREQVKKIQVDSQGNLTQQFGSGFFDESLMLQEELLKKQELASLKNEIEKFNKDFQTHIKCLILTEDMKGIKDKPKETKIGLLLKACGFNLNETQIMSYRSCDKLKIALGMAEMAEGLPNIKKIILHRDKDGEGYKRSNEMQKHIISHGLKKTSYFITQYNDIEGYFLNPKHINALYPELPESEIQDLIDNAMESVKEKSIDNLTKKYNNNRDGAASAYNSNPIEYAHTKYLKGVLNSLLNSRLGKPPNIFRFSRCLHDNKLSQIANEIWPKLSDS